MMPGATLTRDEVVKDLAVASLSGTLVLFVGAGFSKALTGGAAPTWGQLLQSVAQDLGLEDPLRDPAKIVGSSFPRIASDMALRLARDVADEGRFKGSSPLEQHAEAVRRIKMAVAAKTTLAPDGSVRANFSEVFKKLDPRALVTTNYDFIVESCLEHSETLLPDQVVRARRGCIPVFHLHGHLLHPDSIVLLESDYVRALNHGEYGQGADPPRTPIDRVIGRRASRRFPLDESATAAAHG